MPPTSYPVLVMPSHTSPGRLVTAFTLTACFALGVGGAYSGAALHTRSAVAQTHSAAHAVTTQMTALEASLERADASIRASAFASDDPKVATAAAAVSHATRSAVSTTQAHETVITSATATDAPVAKALEATPETSEDVHVAIARLEHTHDELESARALVEDEVRELEQSRLAVKHDHALVELDDLVEQTSGVVASAATTLENVGEGVADATVVELTEDAVALLDSALATARLVDRNSPASVTERTDTVTHARAVLDQRLLQLEDSHGEWIAEQNVAIAESNEAVLASYDIELEQARQDHTQANRDRVTALHNGWSGRPAGMTGANGRLAWDSLCELDFAPHHRLQCDAATSLMAANAQYKAQTGKDLVLTDSYRSYALQVRTRSLKPTTAAPAGSSNHGWGLAIDMDRDSAEWLTEHGADFGWVHPAWAQPGGVRPEWWHLEYVALEVGTFQEPALTGVTDLMVSVFDFESPEPIDDSSNTQLTSANATTD